MLGRDLTSGVVISKQVEPYRPEQVAIEIYSVHKRQPSWQGKKKELTTFNSSIPISFGSSELPR